MDYHIHTKHLRETLVSQNIQVTMQSTDQSDVLDPRSVAIVYDRTLCSCDGDVSDLGASDGQISSSYCHHGTAFSGP